MTNGELRAKTDKRDNDLRQTHNNVLPVSECAIEEERARDAALDRFMQRQCCSEKFSFRKALMGYLSPKIFFSILH